RPPGALAQWTRFGTVTASAYLAAGQVEAARREIAQGFADVAKRDARGYRPSLLRLEAEALARTGDKGAARGRADEALATALELGARPEIGHCHMLLARLTEASEHRVAARKIFDELGMTFWSARG